ncbi:WD40/YVTN/BNR-like repeat-containing protein [Elongatibacter sediminis]|uniref:Sortilin N-terminal domain-containing protein n=1 Tax=Elongatibacter sediminis TaxID=3119006 RepID=A0AAW9RF58_9GAMM
MQMSSFARRFFLSVSTTLLIGLITTTGASAATTAEIEGLEFRLVGPWRGGRVTTVTGVPGKPHLYYMGATGGGVWKTENAGTTWENLSDEYFKVGTIGAVAVSESDNNVVYVGTGESPIRGVTTSHGDGVWKSVDAGKTWKHIGLPEAGQISRIQIHPTNPDIAYIGVQGQIWGPNEQRGVFRTTDGGETWEHVLKVGPETGASDLRMDPTNPNVLYAGMWHHGRTPWFIKSGGTEGGLFKTRDGGDTWEKLEGGLPEMIGKIGVDVSASNPDRVYAIIEAGPDQGGLWRSDDGGASWSLIDGHRVLHTRAWYYIHIKADPLDENTVYVLNAPLMKSIDGGKTWEKMRTPHGDHHDHWINPADSNNMISGNDGGATITFDGGETWSSIMNQPTAQFYRVITDNQKPFRIYGGQQDNTTVAIASESRYGGIGVEDYFDVGGGESAHIAFDPDDPRLIYATSINGTLTEYDRDSELTRVIIPYPEMMYGKDSKDLRYRANWNTPVVADPHDPSVIYYGAQMVLRSDDRGATWTPISPDLTRNDPEKQGRNGGPLTPENVGAEFYNTIFYIAPSPHEQGVIWVGSDDGLVHLTRDGGETWSDVSPKHRGKFSDEAYINAIEVSPHDPATAYLAVAGFKLNDFSPYIYKTTDYGRRWTRIDAGLPEDTFVRVVREDPAQPGLLYAGTEAGLFVSYDDGGNWQSLDLNLPPVPITDLALRHDKLVVATQGRSFWVLDDLFVVRQAAAGSGTGTVALYDPGTVEMTIGSGGSGDLFEGDNPPRGAPLYYYLGEEAEGPLTIEILDDDGQLVRTYSTEESARDRCLLANMDPRLPFELEYPPTSPGLNKWMWDLRRDGVHCTEDVDIFAGFHGPTVAPGDYRARITVGSDTAETGFTLVPDTRVTATPQEIREWSGRLEETAALLDDVMRRLGEVRDARRQVEGLMNAYPGDAELQQSGQAAIDAIIAWDHQINQQLHETYEDEDAWETMLGGQIRYLLDVIDYTGAPITGGQLERLADLKAEWDQRRVELRAISENHLAPINAWAKAHDVPHVTAPGS